MQTTAMYLLTTTVLKLHPCTLIGNLPVSESTVEKISTAGFNETIERGFATNK